jgi:hypothetical protein
MYFGDTGGSSSGATVLGEGIRTTMLLMAESGTPMYPADPKLL